MQEEFDIELGFLTEVPDNLVSVHVVADIIVEGARDYDEIDAWCEAYSVWDANDQFIDNKDLPKNVKRIIEKKIDERISHNLYDYQVDMMSGYGDSLYDEWRDSLD